MRKSTYFANMSQSKSHAAKSNNNTSEQDNNGAIVSAKVARSPASRNEKMSVHSATFNLGLRDLHGMFKGPIFRLHACGSSLRASARTAGSCCGGVAGRGLRPDTTTA